MGVSSIASAAMDADRRNIQRSGHSLNINIPADAVDWFGFEQGDDVSVIRFPDAVLISRVEGDDEF
ncbi:hypothetical protein C5B87_19440 [Haloferax sp. Atlit-16N]|nr:hypothetical protein C5B87_19440 [Haloferax sp. Atlit-16N]